MCTKTPTRYDDETSEIWPQSAVQTWQEPTLSWHPFQSVPANHRASYCSWILKHQSRVNSRIQEIQQATENNEALQILEKLLLRGWPEERSQVPAQVTPYFSTRDELWIQDGVIFCEQWIIAPVSLRCDMKQKLQHVSTPAQNHVYKEQEKPHFGPEWVPKWRSRLRPVKPVANTRPATRKESLMPHEVFSRPWEQVGVDLFELNK